MKLKSNLKNILDERDISIRQLAKDIDYRFDSVRVFYNDFITTKEGKTYDIKQIPIELLVKLCSYLDVSIGELLEVKENDSSN